MYWLREVPVDVLQAFLDRIGPLEAQEAIRDTMSVAVGSRLKWRPAQLSDQWRALGRAAQEGTVAVRAKPGDLAAVGIKVKVKSRA